MGEKRKQWKPEEIAAIMKRHIMDGVEVSKVCEEFGCHASQVLRWKRQMVDGSATLFDRKKQRSRELEKAKERGDELEQKLKQKNEVLAELMAEHVFLKKARGDGSGKSG
jgi:transposase-like protein